MSTLFITEKKLHFCRSFSFQSNILKKKHMCQGLGIRNIKQEFIFSYCKAVTSVNLCMTRNIKFFDSYVFMWFFILTRKH